MLMPEAAMHKNHFPALRENDIRLPWQFFYMNSKPIAKTVEHPAQHQFWAGVLVPDRPHVHAASRFRDPVDHGYVTGLTGDAPQIAGTGSLTTAQG
nr:hypothetical protein [Thiococcus pfennigii]